MDALTWAHWLTLHPIGGGYATVVTTAEEQMPETENV